MIHRFDSSTLPVSRWRNGGGETREIMSFPPGVADFSWRVSIATLATDGPFSAFPGVDRVITLLEGDGVTLHIGGKAERLIRHRPLAFAGEEIVSCQLAGSESRDFNVMTRRTTHRACVSVEREQYCPAPLAAGVVYVLSGEWSLNEQRLKTGQGAWWEAHGPTRLYALSPSATLLAVTLSERPEAHA